MYRFNLSHARNPALGLPALLLSVSFWLLPPANGAFSQVRREATESYPAWDQLAEISQQLSAESINPPVRQQLVLSAIRGMYLSVNRSTPRSVAAELSLCTGLDSLKDVFIEHWDALQADEHFQQEHCLQSAISAMIQDAAPGARFISPEESRVQKQLRENQYVGIGIQLAFREGRAIIADPFIGGPAQKAGARVGDKIMAVNGRDTKGRDLGNIVDMLRGEKGSSVTVLLQNVSDEAPREYTMIRDVVPIPTVRGVQQNQDESWEIGLPTAPKVAYLKFASIVGSTAAEFNQLARQVKREEMKGLILDFREVGPAELHHAVMICDSLIGESQIAEIKELDGTSSVRTRAEKTLPQLPTLVLYDPSVPGTLFMVLSALKQHSTAKLIGPPVSTDGICRKSVELPDQAGAIEGMPYAFCSPLPTPGAVTEVSHELGLPSPAIRLSPEIPSDKRGDELIQHAIHQLTEH